MASGQLYMHTSLDLGDIWKYIDLRGRLELSGVGERIVGIYSGREDDGGQDVRNMNI